METLQYVKRTANLRVTNRGTDETGMKLSTWIALDHAKCADMRQSVSRSAGMLGQGAISWFFRA